MGESKTRLSNSANISALKPHIPLGNLTGNVFHVFATSENFIYSRHDLNGSLARRLSWPVHEKEDVGQGNLSNLRPSVYNGSQIFALS